METKDTGVFNLYYFIFNYGKYHNNKVNQLLHFVFIPTIQFTLLIMLCHAKVEVPMPQPLQWISSEMNIINLIFVGALQVVYFRTDFVTAVVYFIWSTTQLFASQYLYANKD
jgi:uncharacterized membrane protein YGL010W